MHPSSDFSDPPFLVEPCYPAAFYIMNVRRQLALSGFLMGCYNRSMNQLSRESIAFWNHTKLYARPPFLYAYIGNVLAVL